METSVCCTHKYDLRSVPQFLDQVSDARDNETSRQFSISLYGDLARMHKQAVIPFIPRMMASIVRSLPFSSDSQQLHEACAKVVTSVARYTIDPTKSLDSNQQIIFDLCSPLLPLLSSKLNSSATGAVICLQALVESEKWKFAHPDLQELVCSRVTDALEEQGILVVACFLYLVKSLVRFSLDASKQHLSKWLGVGLQVLQAESDSWQTRLAAAQVLVIILKTVDVGKLGINISFVIKTLEALPSDKVSVVQAAIAEAFETAKDLALERHLLCADNYQCYTPCKSGPANSSCDSRGRASDAEESSNSLSPRSAASSHESIPVGAPSAGRLGKEHKRSKQREMDFLFQSRGRGSFSRKWTPEENAPATMPRRAHAETPSPGKYLSHSDTGEVITSRRCFVDTESKMYGRPSQNQFFFESQDYSQDVQAPTRDNAQKISSVATEHVTAHENGSDIDWTHLIDSEKKEPIPCENVRSDGSEADAMKDIGSQKVSDDLLNDQEKESHGGSLLGKTCLHLDCISPASNSEPDYANSTQKSNSFSTRITFNNSSPGRENHIKLANSQSLQNFSFRAPSDLMHSVQGEISEKDNQEHYKALSDCGNRTQRDVSWTSESFTSSGSAQRGSAFEESFSGNITVNCRESESSGRCFARTGSCNEQHSFLSTIDSASKQSHLRPTNSASAAGGDWLSSSRDSSDREFNFKTKEAHMCFESALNRGGKKSSMQRRTALRAQGRHEFTIPADRSRELHQIKSPKGHFCIGAALGVLIAGLLILALIVVRKFNQSYGLHVLVPT